MKDYEEVSKKNELKMTRYEVVYKIYTLINIRIL